MPRLPPVNAVAAACGLGAIASAAVGAVSTCLTGPTNAIIASAGSKSRHYTGGLTTGFLALAFGLLSPVFTRLLLAAPSAFIVTLAGLAMLRVLQNAFVAAFAGPFSLGALVCFLITVSGVSILNIGAAFWGLLFGFAASWLLERDAFTAGKR